MTKKNPFKISNENISSGDLGGHYKDVWVEESFDIEDDDKKRLTIAHTKKYLGASIGGPKIRLFLFFIIISFGIIVSRVFYLQIISGDYYRSLAEGNRIRRLPIPAERGIIYDRFNHELVRNVPGFSLTIIPQDLPHDSQTLENVIEKTASLGGLSPDNLKELLKKTSPYSYESVTVKENLDYQTALSLYVQNSNLPGVEIESGSERNYTIVANTKENNILSLSHLLGYLGKLNQNDLDQLRSAGYLSSDKLGKAGLEKIYESYLRGTYGRKKIEVNATGKEQDVLAVEAPIPGKNIILTIDLNAQKKMESLVKATAEKTGKRKIAAIAMNPQNGEILALVSWPTFDNNDFANGINKITYQKYLDDPDLPLFNRTIAGAYPPGSTVKLIVSAAALQEKIIDKNTSVNSVGGIRVGGILFKDWKPGGHGNTNVAKAIAWSVNTFFYYVGGGYDKFIGLGIDRLAKYFNAFGLAQKTNIDLPGENSGFVPTKEWKKKIKGDSWFVGDTYNVSIGQGDMLVTPIQVAEWTAVIANGGVLVTPHLAQKIVDPVTKKITTLTYPNKNNGLVGDNNLQIVRQGMRDCVAYGSCKMLGQLTFDAAGKTGTAQWSKNHPTHAWFTSFAPFQNPQIVVTVLVEDGGEGATISMPIAKNFLDWWGKKYLH